MVRDGVVFRMCLRKLEHLQDVMHALVEGGGDVRAVDDQGLSALLNAVKVGTCIQLSHYCCTVAI